MVKLVCRCSAEQAVPCTNESEINNGMVDQKYIDKSGDSSYVIGQRLVVKESDALSLLAIVKKLGTGLSSIKEV
ncbi:MAG: hypothetical protein IJ952_06435, partial [Alistipes sp.]|nr:hypothetical protein [Alistipes sp.]